MTLQSSYLKKFNLFSKLSDSSLGILVNNFKDVSYPKGVEVLREGDAADAFFFVKSGRLEVSKSTRHGRVKLSIISSGQGFGEVPLLTNSLRSATVRALSTVELLRLPKQNFDEIISQEPRFRNVLIRRAEDLARYDRIKTLQPFALLEPDRMYALMARMTEKTYSLGEDIIVQGAKGDYYYVVKSGSVAVLKRGAGEREAKQVALLGEGDGFGEEALISDDPRNATCRAMEETTVYALDKIDFDQILKSSFLDTVFTEDISIETYRKKYEIIDARDPAEYEQEHITGALSMPVDVLRYKYKDLDPAKSYITYCSTDSRGMVAAFLLKNHGFNARCLRGGINCWEGPVASGPPEFAERRSYKDRRAGKDRRKSSPGSGDNGRNK